MSSLPDTSNLLLTPGNRRHKHRRSQAISGDFDVLGLGLFSPASVKISNEHVDYSKPSFNNDEDFKIKPSGSSFAFPSIRSPEIPKHSSPKYSQPMSPIRRNNKYHSITALNSPIKLGTPVHRRAKSSSSYSKTRFFATDETSMQSNNVPDALIDLDKILNSTFQLNEDNTLNDSTMLQANSTNEIFNHDEDFLASPFLKQSSFNPFISSPYHNNVNSTPIFENPLEERNDSIAEEDDLVPRSAIPGKYIDQALDSDDEFFLHPPPTNSIYANASTNSSSSSLRVKPSASIIQPIEKTLSNSSKDSMGSINISMTRNLTPPPLTQKRSGAKANRYQTFYDQSSRISNALKNSSSDSIHLIKVDSNGSSTKESRSLGHSASLPSLKTLKRSTSFNHPLPRFSDGRTHRVGSPPVHSILKNSNSLTECESENYVPSVHPKVPSSASNEEQIFRSLTQQTERMSSSMIKMNSSNPTSSFIHPDTKNDVPLLKPISTSPISIQSNASADILSNTTTEITDHSSFASVAQGYLKPDQIHKAAILCELNANVEDPVENKPIPSIIVSKDKSCHPHLSAVEKTFEKDDQCIASGAKSGTPLAKPITDQHQNQKVVNLGAYSIDEHQLSSSRSMLYEIKSPPRIPSPAERSVLMATQIPTFSTSRFEEKVNTPTTPGKVESNRPNLSKSSTNRMHRRSKSYSVESTLNFTEEDDITPTDAMKEGKSKKRSSRILSWLKRR